MRPKSFNYHRPDTLDEAVHLLGDTTSSEVLAGGQSLIPRMNRRLSKPETLVDISNITELSYISETDDGGVAIGAVTPHSDVASSDLIGEHVPILQDAASRIGDPIVRNRGTIGGNVANAAANADYPPNIVALDATLVVSGESGERRIAASEFFQGDGETQLEDTELLKEIRIPSDARNTRSAYVRVTRRKNDPPLAAVSCVLAMTDEGQCENARIVVGAVDPTPVRATAAENEIEGTDVGESEIADAAEQVADAPNNPRETVHASGEYRRTVITSLLERALKQATSSAGD